jgi:protocatechuate 3,4-dioxygenase beta subunit
MRNVGEILKTALGHRLRGDDAKIVGMDDSREAGTTLVELVISLTVLAIVIISTFSLFVSLLSTTVLAKNKSIATTLATNQMEYLKGLPYDTLAVAGGSIYSASPLPASTTQTLNGVTYTITTSVNYIDDAYDGCTNYPTQAQKELYCRNYPPPTGAPSPDPSPWDFKIINVKVKNPAGAILAQVDTQVAARVAETSSTKGAMLINVIDDNGNPVSGATVAISNTTLAPVINLSDSSDSNGVAIFYGLPPDAAYDYIVTASKTGYSTLATIAPSGALQPTYSSQKVIAQQSSSATLTIKLQGANSLLIEAVDTSGAPINNLKVYLKGGYKKYTDPLNTTYYYDNFTPDTRPTTNASGLATISNLVPGSYLFCGDIGANSCAVGGTTYYLAAALPYSGNSAFSPVNVPRYDPASPPTTTYNFSSLEYLQKVRLVFSTNSSFPRISTLAPSGIALSSTTLTNFPFTITGANLPCAATSGACSTVVRLIQGSTTYAAACAGSQSSTTLVWTLNCTANLTGISVGYLRTEVVAGGNTLTTPASGVLGGINVQP